MKGLVLNHYFSVKKSISFGIGLTIVIVAGMYLTKNQTIINMATLLPFLLIVPPAFEVSQHDDKSGWNKFVAVLPIKKRTFVQSHYLLFLILLGGGALVTFTLFLIGNLIIAPMSLELFFTYLMRGLGITCCLATMQYPLLIKLGVEKAGMIMAISIGFGLGSFFLITYLTYLLIGHVENINFGTASSVIYLAISIVLFIISYFVTVSIYRKKEF